MAGTWNTCETLEEDEITVEEDGNCKCLNISSHTPKNTEVYLSISVHTTVEWSGDVTPLLSRGPV